MRQSCDKTILTFINAIITVENRAYPFEYKGSFVSTDSFDIKVWKTMNLENILSRTLPVQLLL